MPSRRRLAVALAGMFAVVVVCAVALISSGDDGDPKRAASPPPAPPPRTAADRDPAPPPPAPAARDRPYAPAPGTEEARAFVTVTDVYDVIQQGKQANARTVCELMTAEARRETREYARRTAGASGYKWTCPRSVGLIVGVARRYGNFRPTGRAEVVGINVEGSRATASIRFGKRGGLQSVALVKQDGQWRLGSALGR